MQYNQIIKTIADILEEFDAEKPRHKEFKPGIGPFGEPQIVKLIADKMTQRGMPARTKRSPDLEVGDEWAVEFKIVRPFGDNGREAENWTVNLLHPYPGNVSLLGDALKLLQLPNYNRKGLFIIGFEHNPAKIILDPLVCSFELIAREVLSINMGRKIEEKREGLVHPEHQVLRCIGWELMNLNG